MKAIYTILTLSLFHGVTLAQEDSRFTQLAQCAQAMNLFELFSGEERTSFVMVQKHTHKNKPIHKSLRAGTNAFLTLSSKGAELHEPRYMIDTYRNNHGPDGDYRMFSLTISPPGFSSENKVYPSVGLSTGTQTLKYFGTTTAGYVPEVDKKHKKDVTKPLISLDYNSSLKLLEPVLEMKKESTLRYLSSQNFLNHLDSIIKSAKYYEGMANTIRSMDEKIFNVPDSFKHVSPLALKREQNQLELFIKKLDVCQQIESDMIKSSAMLVKKRYQDILEYLKPKSMTTIERSSEAALEEMLMKKRLVEYGLSFDQNKLLGVNAKIEQSHRDLLKSIPLDLENPKQEDVKKTKGI